jgi:hypothetical protein
MIGQARSTLENQPGPVMGLHEEELGGENFSVFYAFKLKTANHELTRNTRKGRM